MTEAYFPIEFDFEGTHYSGRVTPERKNHHPVSYHVVLNEVFFGYLHRQNNHWHTNEQRPEGLVQEAGKYIEKVYPASEMK